MIYANTILEVNVMQAQTSESEVEAVETVQRGKISDEEIQAYERALAEFQERGDEREAAKILRPRGVRYYRRGEWDIVIDGSLLAIHYQNDFVGVIKYNDAARRKQMADWNRNNENIFVKMADIRSKLNRKGKSRKITPMDLTNRVVDAIPKQYRDLFDYSDTIDEGALKLKFKLNTTRETDYIKAFWKAVIFTDMADLTPRQIETDIK